MWNKLRSWFGGAPSAPPSPPTDGAAPDAPGWDAIDAAFRRLHGGPELRHWGHTGVMAMHDLATPPSYPLDGISAWDAGDHWHYVGFGMSELYTKCTEDPGVSGWGYELTLRLARRAGETEPPDFICRLLQQLCQGQWRSGTFAPGHTIRTGRIPETDVAGFVLAEDPGLGTIDTPHGRVTFLLLVGVTAEQLEAAVGGNGPAVLEAMRDGGWITRL